jgi:hypothetical protein
MMAALATDFHDDVNSIHHNKHNTLAEKHVDF